MEEQSQAQGIFLGAASVCPLAGAWQTNRNANGHIGLRHCVRFERGMYTSRPPHFKRFRLTLTYSGFSRTCGSRVSNWKLTGIRRTLGRIASDDSRMVGRQTNTLPNWGGFSGSTTDHVTEPRNCDFGKFAGLDGRTARTCR